MINTNTSILNRFKNLQKIGEGLTSTVYKAVNSQTQDVCLKVIDGKFYSKPIGKLLIDNEVQILKSLNHKNLLKLKSYEKNETENVIITEFCQGGNLYELTKKCKQFTQKQTLIIVEGIVNGLQYLYSKQIIHRDLKPENIFFKKGEPIVADFGFALHSDNKDLSKVNAGSPLYMAPEALQDLDFSIGSEVFSIGVIIFEMLKGKTPWNALSQKQLLNNIISIKPKIELKDKKFENLIIKCLQPKKQKRAKFEQIVEFFNDWREQFFKQTKILIDLNNVQNSKSHSKSKKKQKTFKLNLPKQEGKQNQISKAFSIAKTSRLSVSKSLTNQYASVMLQKQAVRTKRLGLSKIDKDFNLVLNRIDPDQMRFLPASMIEKFKFILKAYSKIVENEYDLQEKDIPKGLKSDKVVIETLKCKNEKQFCGSIAGYVGRMYRLAKNYKVYSELMRDLQALNKRIQSFC